MTIPETSLTWLGRLIESPDGADWQRLSDLYAPLLRNWAVRAGVPVSDVDDVTQDVLIVVINVGLDVLYKLIDPRIRLA